MAQLIITLQSGLKPLCIQLNNSNNSGYDISSYIEHKTGICSIDQSIQTMDGKVIGVEDRIDLTHPITFLQLSGRVLGGKGGFGSMLRAQGGRMNSQKTTNYEACRDLQGRRIRTVNDAKKLQEELDALPEREKEKKENLKRKIEEALKERPQKKHLFDDNEFLKSTEDMVENVKSAVTGALKKQKITHTVSASSSTSIFDDETSSEEEEEEEEVDAEKKREEIEAPVKEEQMIIEQEEITEAAVMEEKEKEVAEKKEETAEVKKDRKGKGRRKRA
ncbi:telomere stability and silencing-domain-containing protein [Pilobolus umbonatus]|nr:telomere stability and silencing-domain-containing protein [Pilobolus umbonatus]